MVKLFQVKRTLTSKEKLNAIFATFGSLSDFSCKLKVSYTKLSEELGIKRTTLSELIYRFKSKYSSNLDHFIVGHKRPGRPRQVIGSVETEKFLLSSACLTDWVHLTLRQRSAKIKKLYGVDVQMQTLRNFYLRNGVKQTPAYAKLYPNRKDPVQLEAERIEFAMRMSDWIMESRPVIYFDETTFNPDMHQKKAWYYRGSRFAVPLRK